MKSNPRSWTSKADTCACAMPFSSDSSRSLVTTCAPACVHRLAPVPVRSPSISTLGRGYPAATAWSTVAFTSARILSISLRCASCRGGCLLWVIGFDASREVDASLTSLGLTLWTPRLAALSMASCLTWWKVASFTSSRVCRLARVCSAVGEKARLACVYESISVHCRWKWRSHGSSTDKCRGAEFLRWILMSGVPSHSRCLLTHPGLSRIAALRLLP